MIYGKTSQPTLDALYGPAEDLRCPRSVEVWNTTTGEFIGYRNECARNDCIPCCRAKVRRLARRIARVKPTHMVTITDLPTSWDQVRPALTEFRRITKRAGHDWSWIHHVERDPSLRAAHNHAWAKGDVPPISVLTDAAARAGLGTVHRQPVVHYGGMDYAWKGPGHNRQANADARTLNGSRLWHASPGFLKP